ncbi:MAG: hypothetical protein FWF23_04225 [Alphaproteobacteria bacterium]|nr:hypothetical protein [Alphaproteobacteria bacterium]MCL2505222.1 hypothetical protein [Alphaproteobacteria bacterium]
MNLKIILLFVLVVLSACSSSTSSLQENKPEIKLNNLICPQVAILREAKEALYYGNERITGAISDSESQPLLLKARMFKIDGSCRYDKDGKDSGADIDFTITSAAVREKAGASQKFSLSYFVAVVDPVDEIIFRRLEKVTYKFSSKDRVTEAEDRIKLFIPIPEEKLAVGPGYRVLVGYKVEQ